MPKSEENHAALCLSPFSEDQVPEVPSVQCYQHSVFSQSSGKDIRVCRGRAVFGNPGNVVAGIS